MQKDKSTNNTNLIFLAKPYMGFILVIMFLSLVVNGLGLAVPKITASVIDAFRQTQFSLTENFIILLALAVGIFIFSIIQSFLQTYLSERIGLDLRTQLIAKISEQEFSFINKITPEKLLTNLTGDIDNIKQVIAQGLIQVFSSIVMIIGSATLLLSINLKLALIVLTIIPIIGIVFFTVVSRIRKYFLKAQAAIDKLNKTINESIVASALVRILNAQRVEYEKFCNVSNETKEIGLAILNLFSSLLPIIGGIANMAIVAIFFFGGQAIITGSFTVGELNAFISYIYMLIFPIIVIGFISNALARATVSYTRISEVLFAPTPKPRGIIDNRINGRIEFKNVFFKINDKEILKDISFTVKAKSRTAILGPTAAGKTQIFYLIAGLTEQTAGEVLVDGIPLMDYSQKSLSDQIGLVFQDSSIFNTTIKENINFKNIVNETNIEKAIRSAELQDFIKTLPLGINTKIAERGLSLSGGQKQRLTLARALVIDPKVLLLDDFTARVDKDTEKKIFHNIKNNYKDITQILITQQISSVIDFDEIILMMEGEILAKGTHKQLLESSVEYKQIYNSQMSTI
jgi:ATP-binding cassette subfamily B protein